MPAHILNDEVSRERILALIRALDPSGQPAGRGWRIAVGPNPKRASDEQRRLYHQWIGIIANHAGDSHEGLHEWCKLQWLEPKILRVMGIVIEIRTTKGLLMKPMAEYMNKVEGWAASFHGLMLPTPSDLGWDR